MSLVDQEARDVIATALDQTLVVEAAAGTGKTTALVGRIAALIATGTTRLAHIAAVTFTEKASGEMKLRLRSVLEDQRSEASEQVAERLEQALGELEAAHISTIHGFCAELLRERPVEAGLDPRFAVLDEAGSEALFDEVFAGWWQRSLAELSPALRRHIRRAAARHHSARESLRRTGWQRCGWRDHRAPLARPPLDRDTLVDDAIAALVPYANLAEHIGAGSDKVSAHVRHVAAWMGALRSRERASGRDHDAAEAQLVLLRRRWDWERAVYRDRYGRVARAELMAARQAAWTVLDDTLSRLDADLAAALDAELWPVVDAYVRRLRREGAADYFDLLGRTAELLRTQPEVRRDLQQRFTHLLVDEFQDTDPLQADIVLLLAADDPTVSDPDAVRVQPGKLFVVGDPKQSIYRFRRADLALYHAVRDRLVQQGGSLLRLSTNFRSDPRIQSAVNVAMQRHMRGPTQAEHVPLAPYRPAAAERPAVVALSIPEPYGQWGLFNNNIAASEPAAVARFVEWLVLRSGWTVPGPDGEAVPIAAHHICLLFRRFHNKGRSVALPYSDAIEATGLPSVLVGGRSLHEREEVQALHTALRAIERPDDSLAVYATLRGPLFAVGDDALLWHKHHQHHLHPLAPPLEAPDELCAEVQGPLNLLGELHRQRNRRPIAETLRHLLDATRAPAGLALWSGGVQALANAGALIEHARHLERERPRSFRDFVEHLDRQAERGGASEAPVIEEGTDGVRIMTVHKSKGLEFPVVILCDTTYAGTSGQPGRYVDSRQGLCAQRVCGLAPWELSTHRDALRQADEEEALRLLYVAATRARELLVVPAVADEAQPGWTAPLHAALYPPPDSRGDGVPSPGCPDFGPDATVVRQGRRIPPVEERVRPGRYAHAGLDLTWWDGHLLGPPPEEGPGFRPLATGLLAPDRDLFHQQIAARHQAWLQARAERLERAQRPSERILTPSSGEAAAATAREVQWEHTERAGQSPGGRRFGELVHEVLAVVPLDADGETVQRHATLRARILGEEGLVDEACRAVEAALAHPVFAAARTAERAVRELPLAHRRPDNTVMEGVADLVLFHDEGITVVDYKTDRDPGEERRRTYEQQVRMYADALAEATGREVRAVLLSV